MQCRALQCIHHVLEEPLGRKQAINVNIRNGGFDHLHRRGLFGPPVGVEFEYGSVLWLIPFYGRADGKIDWWILCAYTSQLIALEVNRPKKQCHAPTQMDPSLFQET
jgi:hypothetical protein